MQETRGEQVSYVIFHFLIKSACSIVQGYAYILTHPGQPCVFWDHVFDWGDQLRNEIIRLVQQQTVHTVH